MAETERPIWHFTPAGGGIAYGYNHAAAEHFKQNPIGKTIRETIQNSLDAHADGLPATHVDIRECEIPADCVGAANLSNHLEFARQQTAAKGQTLGEQDYQRALHLAAQPNIRCLSVIDRNTTGLVDPKWDRLIFEEGTPDKDDPAAGGSFGIGKNAPYNLAGLHAVIYSTRYLDPRRGRIAKMTGRAQLVTHTNPYRNQTLQPVGFYGQALNRTLLGADIPEPFRLSETGTGLWILGFNPDGRAWRRAAVRAIVDNFFYAIHRQLLVVTVAALHDTEPQVVSHDTIDSILENGAGNPRTIYYYHAARAARAGVTNPADAVSAFNVQISQEPDAPRRVAYVNRHGMLITDARDRQSGNPFHPGSGQGGWPDYAAVITAADDATEQRIRSMENPAHGAINPGRLPPADQPRVRAELNRAAAQIRVIIDNNIREHETVAAGNVSELSQLFPDREPTESTTRRRRTAALPRLQPRPNRTAAAIRSLTIYRTGPNRLTVAITLNETHPSRFSFTLRTCGEARKTTPPLTITELAVNGPSSVRAKQRDNAVTVSVRQSYNRAPINLTLGIPADTPYTGYDYAEHAVPDRDAIREQRREQIRRMLADGHTPAAISRAVGLHRGTVRDIIQRHQLRPELAA